MSADNYEFEWEEGERAYNVKVEHFMDYSSDEESLVAIEVARTDTEVGFVSNPMPIERAQSWVDRRKKAILARIHLETEDGEDESLDFGYD